MNKIIIFIMMLFSLVYARREADRYFATNLTITNNTVNLEVSKGLVGSIYDVLIVNENSTSGEDIKVRWNSTTNPVWIIRANRTITLSGVSFSKIFISNDSGASINILFLVVGH